MNNRIFRSLIWIILLLIIIVPIFAMTYSATITVTESSGNTYTDYPFTLTIDNAGLVTGHYMSASGLDQQINYNGSMLKSMVASDRTNFVASVAHNSSIYPQFSLGNALPTIRTMPIIVGNGGKVTIPYNIAIEPGNNFAIVFSGYINTSLGVGKYNLEKLASLNIGSGTTTDGYITAKMYAPDRTVAIPVSTGEHTISVFANTVNFGIEDSKYDFNHDGVVNIADETVLNHYILFYPGIYNRYYDINNDGQIDIADVTVFDYHFGDPVTISTIALAGASVPNTGVNWMVNETNVMPYMDYFLLNLPSLGNYYEVINYQPKSMISGTTLPNSDNPGTYDGTINFGSNPAGITVSIASLSGTNNVAASPVPTDMVNQTISSGGLNSEEATQPNNLLTPAFQPFATLSNIPLIAFFLIIATVALVLAIVLTVKYTQNQLIASIVLILGEVFFYKIGIYQLWFVIGTFIICGALIIFERKPSL